MTLHRADKITTDHLKRVRVRLKVERDVLRHKQWRHIRRCRGSNEITPSHASQSARETASSSPAPPRLAPNGHPSRRLIREGSLDSPC